MLEVGILKLIWVYMKIIKFIFKWFNISLLNIKYGLDILL